MTNTTVLRRFNHLKKITENSNLEDYFNIQNTETRKITFEYFINIEKNTLELHIKFLKNVPKVNFTILPDEVCDIISSFNDDLIIIKFEIMFPSTYPFNETIWSLINVEYNVKTLLNLKNYYTYLVDTHNNRNKHDWSTAILIDKDILEFFGKMNYFEDILEYN